MKKQCFICKHVKNLKQFYTHKQMPDGHINKCIECTKNYINQRRINNREENIQHKKNEYRTNYKVLWNVRYHGMKTRVNGTSISKRRSSFGKELCSKEEFFNWCYKNFETFNKLFKNWQLNNFERKLSPSIDRLENSKGYTLDNIRWITTYQNTIKK